MSILPPVTMLKEGFCSNTSVVLLPRLKVRVFYPPECCLSVGLSWLWRNRHAAQTSCVKKSLFSCVELCIVLWYNRCIVHDNHLISVLLCHMLLMFLMFAAESSQWGHICKWGSQTVFVYEAFRPNSHSSWMYRQLKCNIWTQLDIRHETVYWSHTWEVWLLQ